MMALAITLWSSLSAAYAEGTEDPEFCVALRGNGYKVPVTLAALARLTEEFGVAEVVLGSSSGSIAAFLYENILSNPALRQCAGQPCPPDVLARRVSLALKSMLGFGDYLRATSSGQVVARTAEKMATGQGPGLAEIWAVLTDPALVRMINTRAVLPGWALLNPFNWSTHATRLQRSARATNFGSGVDFELLVREGLLDLEYTVRLIGQVGDFYSNSGPDLQPQWQAFFQHCTGTQINTGWPSIARRPMPQASSCGTALKDMVTDFNARAYPPTRRIVHRATRRVPRFERIVEPASLQRTVGQNHPTLMTASLVTGSGPAQEFADLKKQYDRFRNLQLTPRDWLQQFRVAYFGPPQLLNRIARNERGFGDVKSQRFYPAGEERWGETMVRSIGEPGLQAARTYRSPAGEVGITAGGWVDNFGTQPLKNLGCKAVAFVTRRGTDSNFASAVARQLGADDDFVHDLFAPTAGTAVGNALANADAIVCTDWDSFNGPLNSPMEMAAHGYESPLVTQSAWFLNKVSDTYDVQTTYDTPGCKPPTPLPQADAPSTDTSPH